MLLVVVAAGALRAEDAACPWAGVDAGVAEIFVGLVVLPTADCDWHHAGIGDALDRPPSAQLAALTLLSRQFDCYPLH